MAAGKVVNLVYKLSGIAVLLLSFVGGWLVMEYKDYVAKPLPIAAPGYHYVITPGTSLKRFSDDLHSAGILPKPYYFSWMARFAGDSQAIKAGAYLHHRGRMDLLSVAGGLAP
jgi:cell division protein YceG involved in septum cleavage